MLGTLNVTGLNLYVKKGRDVVLYRIWYVIPRDRLYKRTWRGTRVCVNKGQ